MAQALNLLVGVPRPFTSSGVPSPDNVFLTESSDFYITEGGDFLEINEAPAFSSEPLGFSYTVTGASNMLLYRATAGSFMMGSPSSDNDRSSNEGYFQVNLSDDFYIGATEVSKSQYETIMTGNNMGIDPTPAGTSNMDRPITHVDWSEALLFCALLNGVEQQAGRLPEGWTYDLPTEAQWEYVARGLPDINSPYKKFPTGSQISTSNANYNSSVGFTQDVGTYVQLGWGTGLEETYISDIAGNAAEWVKDKYSSLSSTSGPQTDFYNTVASSSLYPQMYKGGAYNQAERYQRIAKRTKFTNSGDSWLGFRIVLRQT